MNDFILLLNRAGDAATAFAGPALLQSAVLIAVVAVLDRLLRRHATAAVRAALWLLVLVKLALPPSLALPTGVGYWLNREPALPPQPPTVMHTVVIETEEPPARPLPAIPVEPPRPSLRSEGWLVLAWAGGALMFAGLTLIQSGRVRRLTRLARPAPPELTARLKHAAARLGLRRAVHLRLADSPHGPLVFGLFRPVILLPERLAAGLDADQLDDVLLHELAHVRRGDLWTGHAQALLQCFWWWHPFVWLAGRRLDRVREEAADEAVLAALDREPPRYAETLVAVARLVTARPGLTLGFLGILERRSALRRRIERLLDGPAPRRRLGWGAALLLAAFAAAALPMAPGPAKPAEEPAAATTPWSPWSGEAVTAARAAGRLVLVNFTADWDLISPANRRNVLAAPAVRDRLAALGVVTLEGDHTRFDPEIAAELANYGRGGVPLTLVFPPQPVGPAEALPEVLTPERVLAALERAAGHAAVPAAATPVHPSTRIQVDGRNVSAEELQRLLKHGHPPADTNTPSTSASAPTGAEGDAERQDIYRRYFLLKRQSEAEGGTNLATEATLAELRRTWRLSDVAAPAGDLGSTSTVGEGTSYRFDPAFQRYFSFDGGRGTNAVPVLRDIPVLGRLFTATNENGRTDQPLPGIAALREQLGKQEQAVEQARERLEALSSAGQGAATEEFVLAKRQLENDRIMLDVLRRKLAQETHDAAVRQKPTTGPSLAADQETAADVIAAKLAEARAELAALRTRYRDGWPAVVAQQARVTELERQVAEESGVLKITVTGGSRPYVVNGQPLDRAGLVQALARRPQGPPNSVRILADSGVPTGTLVRALGAAREADVTRVTVAPPAEPPAKAAEPPPRSTSAARPGATLDPAALGRLGTVTLEPPPVMAGLSVFAAGTLATNPPAAAGTPATNALFTRFYRLAPHRLVEALRRSGVPEAAQASTSAEALRAYFKAAGVEALPPKALFLNEEKGLLMARLPMDELEIVQNAVEMLNMPPPLVQVETQFVTAAGDAGFNELLGDRDFVVLSQARTGELTQRLQRTAGVELLTGPRITTLSGRQAQVQLTEAKTVVRPEHPQGQPEDFGLTVDVVPYVERDGVTLNLVVMAGFREFLGYEEGEATPRPRIRSHQTRPVMVVLLDGQTLLARLRPAPGGAPDDAGGLILVTPTLVDPAGNPVHHGPR